jgi:hypothetical protein
MIKEHEDKDTLVIDVDIPLHDDRKTTVLFIKTKKMLIKIASILGFTIKRPAGRCWICQRTAEEAGPLEAHHLGIERCYIGANIKWDLVREDWPIFDWKNFDPSNPVQFIDNMSAQGILLCKEHHTGIDTGIHRLPFSIWIMQRYLADGTRFNPNEIIHHEGEGECP